MSFPHLVDTDRLVIRRLSLDDAGFVLELFNEEAFLRNIGDKGLRSQEDARRYLRDGPMDSYRRFGFGMYRVELEGEGTPVGICGLRTRDCHQDIEIGFAMVTEFRRRGYALESAAAVIKQARDRLGLSRVVAITNPDNRASKELLRKLGFELESAIRMAEDGPELDFFTMAL